MSDSSSIITSLIAGSIAGILVDIILFPIDTIKTRLQSSDGFWAAGGFKGVYKGLLSAALGSAPGGASFFFAYEFARKRAAWYFSNKLHQNLVASCIGEAFCCVVRIPFEVVKQNAQAVQTLNSKTAFTQILNKDGVCGLFHGFFGMLFREIPFALIQMPIWEYLKSEVPNYTEMSALHSGFCGFIAGGIAAALTTPLDVAKTRIILSQSSNSADVSTNPIRVLYQIGREEGISGLFLGVLPRVAWISTGGFIFLGTYDQSKILVQAFLGF